MYGLMLQKLRTHSQSWYFKAIFVLLALSFVMWGVADMITGYNSMRPIATIGSDSLSQEEFMHEYDQQIRSFQERTRGKVKLDEDKKKTIQQEILAHLIEKSLVRQTVEENGLTVTDAYISRHIQSDQTFYDDKNRFNKEKFSLLLNRAHITEGSFVKMVRSNLSNSQLLQTLTSGAHLPNDYAQSLFKAQEQEKTFAVVHVPLTAISLTTQPTEEELQNLYSQDQEQFKKPATKKITILLANAQDIKNKIDIPESILQDEYQKRVSEFKIPEKRFLQVIHANSAEALQNVASDFSRGHFFPAIAREIKGKFEELPEAVKTDLSQEAQVVFDLPKGRVSEPINLVSSWAVYVTLSQQPEYQKSFEDVREDLISSAREEKMSSFLEDFRVKIDDGVAGGSDLNELAKDLNLEIITIPQLTEKGTDLAGNVVLSNDLKEVVMEKIAELSEGFSSEVVDLINGNMVVIRVDKETPAFTPPFTEIKDDVLQSWREAQQQQGAANLAQTLAKSETFSDFSVAVQNYGLTLKTLAPISRSALAQNIKESQELPASLWRQAFTLKENTAAVGPAQSGFMVVRLIKTIPLNMEQVSSKYEEFKSSLTELLKQDMTQAYFKALKQTNEQAGKLKINEEFLTKLRQR